MAVPLTRGIILQSRNLVRTYHRGDDTIHALDHVDIRLERGEFVAVAGPSGSGKTTLLNILGLLDSPDEGEVILDGREIDFTKNRNLTALRRRHFGFVFQNFNLIPVLSAYENVEMALVAKGMDRKTISERSRRALDLVGLSDRMGHRPRELSGGQQQRVAVARAIVDGPSIIFADEPTANLDSVTAASILELLRSINESLQTTIMVSTHDPRVIAYAARRLDLRDGRVIEGTEK
jgi:putative ABC transport system ATP-binding protein